MRRTIPVNVLDSKGNQVTGLTAANFRGEFRGQPVKVLSATLDQNPRRIVLVLDASGSMAGPSSPWEVEKMTAEDLALISPRANSIALLIFASQVETKIQFIEGRDRVIKKLTELRSVTDPVPKGRRKTA